MKKLLFICAVAATLLPSTDAQSQTKWSAGYRSGIQVIEYNLNHNDFNSKNVAWVNEAFVARRLGRIFEVEAGLRLAAKSSKGTSGYLSSDYVTQYEQTITHLTGSLVARAYFLRRGNFECYAQIGTSVLKSYYSIDGTRTPVLTGNPETQFSDKSNDKLELFSAISPGVGFNYNLNRQFFVSLNLTASYKTDASDLNSSIYWATYAYGMNNDWSSQALLGIGVRF